MSWIILCTTDTKVHDGKPTLGVVFAAHVKDQDFQPFFKSAFVQPGWPKYSSYLPYVL